jgi:hypothetical protein
MLPLLFVGMPGKRPLRCLLDDELAAVLQSDGA